MNAIRYPLKWILQQYEHNVIENMRVHHTFI